MCCCFCLATSRFFCNLLECNLPGSTVHEIFRQEYWNVLSLPSPGDLPNQGVDSSPLNHLGSLPAFPYIFKQRQNTIFRNTEVKLFYYHILSQNFLYLYKTLLDESWAGIKIQEKYQQSPICRWYNSNGRQWGGTKEPLEEGEKAEWKSWLKTQHSKN